MLTVIGAAVVIWLIYYFLVRTTP